MIEQKIFDRIADSPQLTTWFSQMLWKRDFFYEIINLAPIAFVLLNDKNKVIFSNQFSEKYFYMESKWSNRMVDIFKVVRYKELKTALSTLLNEETNLDFVEFNLLNQQIQDLVIKLFHFKFNPADVPWLKSGVVRVMVILDITQWRNQSLKKNQEQSINSLNILTAGIAHEIKNPLGALDLHLQLVKRFLKKHAIENRKELDELIEIINQEISRLESIVNDFLFSFRSGIPQKHPLLLNEIITETVQILSPRLEDKKIDIQLNLDPKLDLFLLDRNRIKQMLINLMENSIESILEEQDEFAPGQIRIQTKEYKEKIVLILSDNGMGIKKENFTEIFQPFYTSKTMGTGLGLSIVTKIVHEHDGEIILNQDVKQGAEFIIEFQRIKSNLLSGY